MRGYFAELWLLEDKTMKKLIILGVGFILLSGCTAKSRLQKRDQIDDEPVMVTSSIVVEITQEMIDRYYATHPKNTEQ